MDIGWGTRATAALGVAVLGIGAAAIGARAADAPADASALAGGAGGSGVSTVDWGRGGSWGQLPGYGGSGGQGLPQWSPGSVDGSAAGSGASVEEALSATAATAVAAITPSVVNIDTVVDYGVGQAAGTGIVLSADGLVLTNHHVVEGATSITGTVVGTGGTYTATVVGFDPTTDVAVVDLTGASGLPVATLGDPDSLELGELVVGVGNAGGDGGQPTSVEGVVTALDQTITATDAMGGNAETLSNLIATDANIQSGQSGGPLVDASGSVVGVDVAASSGASYGVSDTNGFAIPIDDAVAVARRIVAGQGSSSVHIGGTPFLGVQLGSGSQYGYGSTGSGVTVSGVVAGSAAESVGLAAGDTITAVDGTDLSSAEQLSSLIAGHAVGDQLRIAWVDPSGTGHQATAQLGAGPVG
jgi:S1-C subfamily serine protease